jgi:threonine/homoserine/homoserine lactone efflux protein
MTVDFLKGILVGFSVAAPVGPIALLVMKRSVVEGRVPGLISGLGAATADLICGSLVALGLSAITALLAHHQVFFQLFGGVFMVVLGVQTARSAPPSTALARPVHERNLLSAYLSTCGLTLLNPLTWVGLAGVIAAAGMGARDSTWLQAGAFVVGIFLGSCLWWTLLSTGADWLGRKLGPKFLPTINRSAGVIIVGFGVWQLIEAARHGL